MLFHNTKQQVVGELKEGIFRKKVYGSKHLLKLMDAWGIDSSIIRHLQLEKATQVRIKDMETDTVYAISLDDFMLHSVERDYGAGKQLFVSRKFFEESTHTAKNASEGENATQSQETTHNQT